MNSYWRQIRDVAPCTFCCFLTGYLFRCGLDPTWPSNKTNAAKMKMVPNSQSIWNKGLYLKARMDSTCPVSHCCVFSALCHILIAIACVSFILLLLLTSYLFNRILFRRSNVFEAMWTLTGSKYGLTLAWSWTLNIASPILNQGFSLLVSYSWLDCGGPIRGNKRDRLTLWF